VSGSGRQAAPTLAWPALLVALSIPALYYLQSQVTDTDSLYRNYGLLPFVVQRGEPLGLFTSLLLHGNWAHALMNAVFALGFGLPVARLMGNALHHGISYILFYIACGIAANLVYVGLHGAGASAFVPLIGASGAVSGLMGGTARLIGTRGVLGPVLSRTVFFFAAALVIINLTFAVMGRDPASGQMSIAWEVHLAGFFFGLLLIGPWAALFGKRSIAEAKALPPLAPRPEEVAPPAEPGPAPEPIAEPIPAPAPAPESAPVLAAEPQPPAEPL
jgi:membrane associated rhomboid family serine protease